jgi:hypothetical protein
MFKSLFSFLLTISLSFVKSQDCYLSVPFDPLNTGLFSPWYLSTNPISEINCSQLTNGTEVFVEATIYDVDNHNFFVYNPLVIDILTLPALQPKVVTLPSNSVVIIHIGINGNSVTLIPNITENLNSLEIGKCVNGLPNGSLFGQFAYCNAIEFYQTVNNDINKGLLQIPPILNSTLGDICPTTRSFSIVDQDQSDNVLTQYIITKDLKLAQDTPYNRDFLKVLKIISNGSDNRLLSEFINSAIGCKSFKACNLVHKNIKQSSVALNEIQANLIPISLDVALVPSFNPMVLDNNLESIEKVNLYRDGVNQPHILSLDINNNINYCIKMSNLTPPFLIKHESEFSNMISPVENISNNLLNFLAFRFEKSWEILKCKELTKIDSPITTILDPVSKLVISNNLLDMLTTPASPTFNKPTTSVTNTYTSTSVLTTQLLCGNRPNNVNCNERCISGLNSDCITPDFQCYIVENNYINCNIFNFCGNDIYNLKCSEPCPLGFDSECKIKGDTCFKDIINICSINYSTTSYPIFNTTSDTTSGPTSGPTSDTTSGPTSDTTSGPTSGPTSDTTSGPTSDTTSGPTSDTTSGPTSDTTSGPTSGTTSDTTSGPTSGPTSYPTSGPTSDITSGPITFITSNSVIFTTIEPITDTPLTDPIIDPNPDIINNSSKVNTSHVYIFLFIIYLIMC